MADVAGLSPLPEPQCHVVATALADVVKAVRRARDALGHDMRQRQWFLALECIEERAQMMLRLVR